MHRLLLSPILLLVIATPASAQQWGLACSGTETVQSGDQAPARAPYEITLSLDLGRKLYCYGACGLGQTYAIADGAAAPIILADVQSPAQSRHMLFDRATGSLTDDQHIALGAGIVVDRHARASCKPAPFHSPPSP